MESPKIYFTDPWNSSNTTWHLFKCLKTNCNSHETYLRASWSFWKPLPQVLWNTMQPPGIPYTALKCLEIPLNTPEWSSTPPETPCLVWKRIGMTSNSSKIFLKSPETSRNPLKVLESPLRILKALKNRLKSPKMLRRFKFLWHTLKGIEIPLKPSWNFPGTPSKPP